MKVLERSRPRRMTHPKWLDVRIIGGVLLLVASVVVGAKVIGGSSQTSPVWVASQDLSAGAVLAADDLVAADVNLGDQGAAYVDAASALDGSMLNQSIKAGELLPASALQQVSDGRIVAVAVSPEHLAPGVGHGSLIDLYLTTGRAAMIGDEVNTRLVEQGITVQSLIAPASGGLSGAISSRYQVSLLLSPSEADTLVRQLPLGEPIIVLHMPATATGFGG